MTATCQAYKWKTASESKIPNVLTSKISKPLLATSREITNTVIFAGCKNYKPFRNWLRNKFIKYFTWFMSIKCTGQLHITIFLINQNYMQPTPMTILILHDINQNPIDHKWSIVSSIIPCWWCSNYKYAIVVFKWWCFSIIISKWWI